MANQTVAVTLTARDNASPAFKQVGASATAAGRQIDTAGQSVGRFDTVMSRLSRTGMIVGGALGALSGIMADSARKSAEAEISNERLRISIEATGASFEDFEQRLQAAGDAAVQMGFDDEEAADAIARLTQSTGDAGDAIEQLGLIMDIARGRGISLAEATRIVEAVETGRMSVLRRLGIVLDETMSKEEALAELQRRYAGQAESYSQTTMGFYDRVRNQLENVQESLGDHAGALQTVLVLLPGLSAGWTAASAALGGLFNMLGGTNGVLGQLGTLLTRIGGARAGLILGITAAVADGLLIATAAGEDTDKIWDDFAARLPQMGAEINTMTAGAGDAMRVLGDDAVEAFTAISTAAQRAEDAWADDKSPFPDDLILLGNAEVAAINLGQALFDFNNIMAHTGPGAAAAQAQLAELFAEFNDPQSGMNAVQLFDGITAIGSALDQIDSEAAAKLGESFRSAGGDILLAEAALKTFNEQVLEFKHSQLEQQFNAVAAAYTATTDALSNGFRVIVSNTRAVGQQSDAVFKWAEELIAAEGTYSKLDDLLASGAITQREYNAAQEAYNTIATDNAAIQEDILSIQAQQAPIVAQLMADQAAYWDSLADATPEQQRLALAYQDTATSAQALSIAQAAMAGTPGLENLIAGAMQANPLLEDILVSMGIISVGADGTITILTEGQPELENLIAAINALVATEWIARFGGDATAAEAAFEHATGLSVDWDGTEPIATIAADNEPAIGSFATAEERAEIWGKMTATAKANLEDNASGPLSVVSSLLDSLNGRSVTSYITVVEQKIGGLQDGGTLPHRMLMAGRAAAHGMTATLVGERGPELALLPGGAQVMSTEGLRGRTGNLGGSAVNIYIENLYGDETLAEKVSAEIVPAIQRAMALRERGF